MGTITVVIKPNTKHREAIEAGADGVYTVYTKAPAVEGRANRAVVSLVAAHFGVARSRVRILRGATSKRKVIAIDA